MIRFLFLVLLLSGCSSLRPDAVTVALVHQSEPFRGEGPPPFGDHSRSVETTVDGIEGGLEWQKGRLFWDTRALYALRTRNTGGGEWITTFRVGIRIGVSK